MRREVSTLDKAKSGAMLGAGLGAAVGVVFGTITGYSNRKEVPFFETVGKTTISTTCAFSVFVAIGSVLRSSNEVMYMSTEGRRFYAPDAELRYKRLVRDE
eukprot:TRINITY_DN3596_c0_g1_i1.p1 TRINITY_DN3596_c0_g1~~TRINITY_DN3596_c0_g1_i1.p1  ORF type:complete len:101 (+),score=24.42 TRINITY_DN3596_c0_g1_i1:60-362(+)